MWCNTWPMQWGYEPPKLDIYPVVGAEIFSDWTMEMASIATEGNYPIESQKSANNSTFIISLTPLLEYVPHCLCQTPEMLLSRVQKGPDSPSEQSNICFARFIKVAASKWQDIEHIGRHRIKTGDCKIQLLNWWTLKLIISYFFLSKLLCLVFFAIEILVNMFLSWLNGCSAANFGCREFSRLKPSSASTSASATAQ